MSDEFVYGLDDTPDSRIEEYLKYLITGEGSYPSHPRSRVEWYLEYLCEHGGGGGGRAEWGYIEGILSAQTDLIEFVNSTVGTNTANYIYKTDSSGNKVPFDSLAELEAYTGTVTNNDYAFVKTTDSAGNLLYTRYKYSEENEEWAAEYTLNNSSFTAAQWAAMNSGITQAAAAKIPTAIQGVQVNGTDLTPDSNKKVNIPVATSSSVGVSRPENGYAMAISSGGALQALTKTAAQYESLSNAAFIGKGTLDNVLADRVLSKLALSCEMADGTTKTLTLNGTLV